MLMKLYSTQSLIENMIQNPNLYNKAFKQMYMDARQFSSHETVMIIYMIISMNTIACLFQELQKIEEKRRCVIAAEPLEVITLKPYQNLRMYCGIFVIEFILLYTAYTGLFTFEIHYVSVSSNRFASSLNAHMLFWIILLTYCMIICIKFKDQDIDKIGDDVLVPYLLISLFIPFSLTWFYIIYYNFCNKRAYPKGNILKFKKENECINVYTYNPLLQEETIIASNIEGRFEYKSIEYNLYNLCVK